MPLSANFMITMVKDFLTVEGTKVGMCSNVIKESTITSAGDKSVE